jgi:hypothetical protein
MSGVTDLPAQLRAGSLSLDQVAAGFRDRRWPTRDAARSRTAQEAFAAEERDPEPFPEGSFQEAHAAYIRHEPTKTSTPSWPRRPPKPVKTRSVGVDSAATRPRGY